MMEPERPEIDRAILEFVRGEQPPASVGFAIREDGVLLRVVSGLQRMSHITENSDPTRLKPRRMATRCEAELSNVVP
jgi:hypothetical protein